jgi:hypothetical protein
MAGPSDMLIPTTRLHDVIQQTIAVEIFTAVHCSESGIIWEVFVTSLNQRGHMLHRRNDARAFDPKCPSRRAHSWICVSLSTLLCEILGGGGSHMAPAILMNMLQWSRNASLYTSWNAKVHHRVQKHLTIKSWPSIYIFISLWSHFKTIFSSLHLWDFPNKSVHFFLLLCVLLVFQAVQNSNSAFLLCSHAVCNISDATSCLKRATVRNKKSCVYIETSSCVGILVPIVSLKCNLREKSQ